MSRFCRLRLERLESRLNPAPTGATGGGQAVGNEQPSLALTYIIAFDGNTPSASTALLANSEMPFVGEVRLIAGGVVPGGCLPADGRLVSNAAFPALAG